MSTTVAAASTQSDQFTGISVQITNQLAVPVDIYDVFNPSPDGQTLAYQYTKLGTIAAGTTGTVTTTRKVALLEAMYTGNITDLQNLYYYQFPVKFMSGTQFSFGDPAPAPLAYTIADTDWQSMVQSFLFHKFAMANPDSALTKNLNAALKKGDAKSINAFFAGTQNFKSCTLSSWNAVMAWLNMFTSGWQGPYYLYEAAPNPLPQKYVPVLVAALNIVSDAGGNTATLKMCSQDDKGNLVPQNPPQTSTVVMAGDGTMTDQSPGQDVPVSLTPVWMNVIQTSMDKGSPVTSYIAGPIMSGTVAGQAVVSTQKLISLPSQDDKQGKGGASGEKIFGNICQVVGLIVGLVTLYEIAEKRFGSKQSAEEKAKSDSKSADDFKSKSEEIESSSAKEVSQTFEDASATLDADAGKVSESYAESSAIQQKDVLTQTMEQEAESLQGEISEQLENGMTPTEQFETAYQNTLDSFQTAKEQIEQGNLKDASKELSTASDSMQQTIEQSREQMQESEVDALKQSSDAIEQATERADALNESQEKYEESLEDAAGDSGYEGGDESPEVEEIPPEL